MAEDVKVSWRGFDSVNRVVADRYVIVGELGRGGMGVVWRADDRVIGRQVALKEIQASSGSNARTAAELDDPRMVTVYDVLTDRDSTFVVMELVEAPTLADIMAAQGPLAADRVATIGLALLAVLEVAHGAGLVHGDVKPSNVMLLPGDRVKLADFGIAGAMDAPGYRAPELVDAGTPGLVSDLWSLGATLFHAVEGRAPSLRDEEPRLQLCQGPLTEVILGLLSQDPDRRWTPTEVRQALTGRPARWLRGLTSR
jgi:serine/threonine protein kinase